MNEHPTDDLALYALGLVDARERDSIARHLMTCASCREELRSYQATLAALAEGAEREAGRALRARIVERERPRRWFAAPRFALAASLVAAIVLATVAVASLRQLGELRAERDEYARALVEVAEGARIVPLEARGVQGRGAVIVPREGAPHLVLDLPAPPPGKAYEAWLIRGSTPIPAGVAPARGGVVTLELRELARPGDIAAVTLEDEAGVGQPTSDPVLAGAL